MTEREVLKLALEALEKYARDFGSSDLSVKAMYAVREALAQPEQEPVGFTIQSEIDYAKSNPKEYAGFWANKDDDDEDWIALYTTPPQRKPLTDEIPKGVLLAISNAGLTLLKTQHGYELRKLGPAVAHGIKENT